jgi:hypothetical protein
MTEPKQDNTVAYRYKTDLPSQHPDTDQPDTSTFSVQRYQFKISDRGIDLGWIGFNSSEWGIISQNPMAFTQRLIGGQIYYVTAGERWLSVNRNAYVGLFREGSRVPWELRDGRLICKWNNEFLSYQSEHIGYLSARNDFNILTVELVPID